MFNQDVDYPIEDRTEMFWQVNDKFLIGLGVRYSTTLEGFMSDWDYHIDTICDEHIYRQGKYTLMVIQLNMGEGKFLAIYDNEKEIKPPPYYFT